MTKRGERVTGKLAARRSGVFVIQHREPKSES